MAISHVFLTGGPGSGKTTAAEKLAKERGLPLIHGDEIEATNGHWFADTDALRSHLKTLKKPHLIEGVQVLGLNPSELKGHEFITLEPPRDVLIQRLLDRGWENTEKIKLSGKKDRAKAEALVDKYDKIIANWKKRMKNPILNGIRKQAKFGVSYNFSSTQVQLPDDLASLVKAKGLEISDDDLYAGKECKDKDAWNGFGRENDMHITVKYGLHTSDSEKLRELLSQESPVKIKLGKISFFTADDHDVVKCDVDSPDLHRINKLISDNLECTDTYPNYKPHATIAYVKKGKARELNGDSSLKGKSATIDKIVFSSKEGKRVSIVLMGKESKMKTPILDGIRKQAGWARVLRTNAFRKNGGSFYPFERSMVKGLNRALRFSGVNPSKLPNPTEVSPEMIRPYINAAKKHLAMGRPQPFLKYVKSQGGIV